MITFLKSWANQIIVAVIIATIFEMLLPNGNNKKYIKMIIGLYVLFTIIQPIITKVTGNNIDISDFNYKKYFDEDVLESSSQNFEDNNSKLIEQAYIDNIKSDIKTKLKQKGYEVISCNVNIINSVNEEKYGIIENINLKIKKVSDEEKSTEETSNIIKVENVDINISNSSNNNTNNTEEKSNISEKEKTEIIEYLANEYSINKKDIVIN